MSKLDQPLRLKHGLAAVAAALTLGVAGTAIAGGAGQKDAIRANATTAGGGGGGLHYVSDSRGVSANSQTFRRNSDHLAVPESRPQTRQKSACSRS